MSNAKPITYEKLTTLEKVASSANQDSWGAFGACSESSCIEIKTLKDPSHLIFRVYVPDNNPSNYRHIITADPPTVLALVDEVRRLRGWLDLIKLKTEYEYDSYISTLAQSALKGEPVPEE